METDALPVPYEALTNRPSTKRGLIKEPPSLCDLSRFGCNTSWSLPCAGETRTAGAQKGGQPEYSTTQQCDASPSPLDLKVSRLSRAGERPQEPSQVTVTPIAKSNTHGEPLLIDVGSVVVVIVMIADVTRLGGP